MSPDLAAITAVPSKLAQQSRPYVLEAIDKAGRTFVVGRFASMEELAASLKQGNRPAGCGLAACNEDRQDCDEEGYFDGLTEDERDAFSEVL